MRCAECNKERERERDDDDESREGGMMSIMRGGEFECHVTENETAKRLQGERGREECKGKGNAKMEGVERQRKERERGGRGQDAAAVR